MNCWAEYIVLTLSRFKWTIPGMTLLIFGSGFLLGSSTSTAATIGSPLPFLPPFLASGGAAAAGVARLALLSFDLETSALSTDCVLSYVGSSRLASAALSASSSAPSSGFGSSSSSSLSSWMSWVYSLTVSKLLSKSALIPTLTSSPCFSLIFLMNFLCP